MTGPEDEDVVDDIEEISEHPEDDALSELEDEAEEDAPAPSASPFAEGGGTVHLSAPGSLCRDDFYATISGSEFARIFGCC